MPTPFELIKASPNPSMAILQARGETMQSWYLRVFDTITRLGEAPRQAVFVGSAAMPKSGTWRYRFILNLVANLPKGSNLQMRGTPVSAELSELAERRQVAVQWRAG